MGAPHADDTQVIFGVRLPVHLERTIGSPFARAADYRTNIYGIYSIYGICAVFFPAAVRTRAHPALPRADYRLDQRQNL
jgi:hypothetical protein